MKNTIVRNVVKSAVAVAAAAVLVVSAPLTSQAGTSKGPKQVNGNQEFVQYTGSNSSSFVFRIQYENPTAEKFSVIVKNDDGQVVYEAQFNDVHFDISFHIPNDVAEIRPTFTIRNGKQEVERSFLVTKKIVENVVVTKL